MKLFLKKYSKYLFLFLGFLFFNLILCPLNLDEIWSYGFSYNLYSGLVPYRDFNMVITPFHPFFMSLFFHVFGSNILVFHILNSLIGIFIMALMFSFLDKKAWLILPFLFFPLNCSFPNYNFFLLFLFLLFLYGEEKKWPDFVMGFLIGLMFLTKQSVGGIFLFSIFFFWKKWRKMLWRLVGFVLPNVIFLIYLVITKSLSAFLDLCFFGLFDFGNGNGNVKTIFFYLTILLVCFNIYCIWKRKENPYYKYLLLFASLCVPLFDFYHFQLYFVSFLIIFFLDHDYSFLRYQLIGISLLVGLFLVYLFHFSFDGVYPNSYSRFEYRYMTKEAQENTKEVLQLMDKYHQKVMFIGPNAYYYRLILHQKITSLDLINMGNFGYHGSDKLLQKVKDLDSDTVFFVAFHELGIGKQTDQQLIQYIIDHGTLIEETRIYMVYRLGDSDDSMD